MTQRAIYISNVCVGVGIQENHSFVDWLVFNGCTKFFHFLCQLIFKHIEIGLYEVVPPGIMGI